MARTLRNGSHERVPVRRARFHACDFDINPGAAGPTKFLDGSVKLPTARTFSAMPVYNYACAACGPFTAFRPMSDFDKPVPCMLCSAPAPRAILTAPALATMDAGARNDMAVNERSRHAPRRANGGHPAGCGCCGSSKRATAASTAGGAAKSFPNARPWMISH